MLTIVFVDIGIRAMPSSIFSESGRGALMKIDENRKEQIVSFPDLLGNMSCRCFCPLASPHFAMFCSYQGKYV